MATQISLRNMKVNEKGVISSIKADGELGRRIRDMGLVKETEISIIGRAPLQDPVALRLKDFTLTLRNKEADFIDVEVQREEEVADLTIGLVGNPNAGKTTVFNSLTGSRQKVGNYPGITVSKREGFMTVNNKNIKVADLPGTYSLTPYSQEEIAVRNHLINDRPEVLINVIDSNSLERNLYFTVQLLEMGIPLVLDLNMIDEVRQKGIEIDSDKLSRSLGIPVVETVGRTGEGKNKLVEETISFASEMKGVFEPLQITYGSDIDLAIEEMRGVIYDNNFLTGILPARWIALKYLENDQHIIGLGTQDETTSQKLLVIVEKLTDHCKKTLNTTPDELIADHRYGFIKSILNEGVIIREKRAERIAISDKIDKVVTNAFFGPLIMLGILYTMFLITFQLGEYPMGWLESLFGMVGTTATELIPEGLLQSLIVSGIIDGVGGVLGFVPLIFIMFFMIAALEDSGYMARMAYILDKVMQFAGLHGASVMPFVVSGGIVGGCAVPGVMATRTLKSPKEKLATILTAPFLTCGAKAPVVMLLAAAFFPNNAATVLFGTVLFGWVVALSVAKLLRSTIIKGEATPFVMELPPYRMPTLKGVLIHTWERAWQYIKKAGTVILAISILLWAAMTFPMLPDSEVQQFEAQRTTISTQLSNNPDQKEILTDKLNTLNNLEASQALQYSVAGKIGTAMESFTSLAGFDWRVNIALLGGFAAKEVIVASLGTAYSLGEVDPEESEALSSRLKSDSSWNFVTAISLLMFVMIYAPCFVTVVAIAKETSWKWASFSIVFNTAIALLLSISFYQFGTHFLLPG
ncbi:MAG: ferrous iron transport protein B [SAR324 cluster bacterium]|nr:ferrous iron transport protein B [SAR324 cluster bacterium]